MIGRWGLVLTSTGGLLAANQVTIAAHGGLAVLVAVMQTHQASAAVMKPACGALWSLAANNGKSLSPLTALDLLCILGMREERDGRREGVKNG